MKRILLFTILFFISTQVFALDVVSTSNKIEMLSLEIKNLQQRVESLEIEQKQKKIIKVKAKQPQKKEKKYKSKKKRQISKKIKFIKPSYRPKPKKTISAAVSRPKPMPEPETELIEPISEPIPLPVPEPMPFPISSPVTPPSPKPVILAVVATKEIVSEKKFSRSVKAGYTAGAFELGLDFSYPIDKTRGLLVGGSYALGNKYNVVMASLGIIFNLKDFYICPTLNYANYSVPVRRIIGLASYINAGPYSGGGIIIGKKFDSYSVQLGYNNTSGVIAEIERKF